jgi:hypothetical protein
LRCSQIRRLPGEAAFLVSDTCLMFAYAIRLSSDIDQHAVRYFLSRVAKVAAAAFVAVFIGCCSAVFLAKNCTA